MKEIPRCAVIDIETTGGAPGKGRITEIAIFVMEGEQMVEEFDSLVNPEQPIPPYISQLTGITNEMVEDAPKFYEVAKKVVEITTDAIFVAHNASFDYSFIRKEFESLGYNYSREVLCTVRLSRKIIPGFASYSLGNLCRDLEIPLNDRHRAGGDARATALLLQHLIDKQGHWITSGKEIDVKGLRPELDMAAIHKLPHSSGVYYFHNDQGEVIYVGKSKNIYQRVLSHLSAKGKRSLNIKSQLIEVTFEETGSELVALLKEMDEIKKIKPLFNRAGRRTRFNWGLYNYKDRNGYERFFLQKVSGPVKPLDTFASREAAQEALYNWADEYHLCHRLAGLEDKTGSCFQYSVRQCLGACVGEEPPDSYNQRALKMKANLEFESANFALFDAGRNVEEASFVLIQNNALRGYGWIEKDQPIQHPSQLEDFIAGGEDNRDTRQILRAWMRKKSTSKMMMVKFE